MATGFRVMVLLVAAGLAHGCDDSWSRVSSKGKDNSKLVGWLENFKAFDTPGATPKDPVKPGVASCEYTMDKSVSKTGTLPSAEDTHFVLTGFADLTDEGLAALVAADFDWAPAERAEIPRALRTLLPEGEILVSPKFNESFAQNKAFTHGFAARPAAEGSKRIYFVATDSYHPLDMEAE